MVISKNVGKQPINTIANDAINRMLSSLDLSSRRLNDVINTQRLKITVTSTSIEK